MKMDYSDMVRDADRIKKQVWHTMKDMRRNNLEISVRFSWIDLMLAVVGICVVIMSFGWIRKIEKNICVRREAKKLAKEAEQE